MYAIETKKRKFDRILETIKDHANPRTPPQTPLRETASTTPLVDTSSIKRRRLEPPTMSSKTSSATSLSKTANYLPSSREDFLERLETFGPITKWHVPSTERVSAVVWAKRGWGCSDTDMVACKTCDEQLLVKLDEEEEAAVTNSVEQNDETEEDDLSTAAILRHRLLVEKYSDLIITGHAQSCPWRNRGCDESIQRICGLFNTASTLQTLRARYDSFRGFDMPPVHLSTDGWSYSRQELIDFKFNYIGTEEIYQDTLRLAMCGWQASPGRDDVAECRACFRSLGLWLYRGEQPIVEKLDAVESHLEYCPWRSADAQRTEADLGGKKRMVPAVVLVARAMKEAIHRPAVDGDGAAEKHQRDGPELGEKERETKVKELLRRVRELRKPFNVKALLRKKAGAS
jgi:C3HC zinc finger-like/Rsm1-like